MFVNEPKKGIIVKISKQNTRPNCGNLRGICLLHPAAKLILDCIKEHLESGGGDSAGFRSGSFRIDHINTLRVIFRKRKGGVYLGCFVNWNF